MTCALLGVSACFFSELLNVSGLEKLKYLPTFRESTKIYLHMLNIQKRKVDSIWSAGLLSLFSLFYGLICVRMRM